MNTRKSSSITAPALIVVGAGLGLLTAFFLDPISGKTRRAHWRDRGKRLKKSALEQTTKRLTGASRRWRGRLIELKRDFAPEIEVDDWTLVQRVRSQLGHRVSPTRALQIDARRGVITLSGPIFPDQVETLINCVERVPGVKSVRDQMSVSAEGVNHATRH